MIDRSKVKKMYVWDTDPTYKVVRYVIDTFSDGSCLVVAEEYERRFENGKQYTTLNYLHYEKISEDKYHSFKEGEITEKFFDYLFRRRDSRYIYKISAIDIDFQLIKISDRWFGSMALCEDWEMKKPYYILIDETRLVEKHYTDWIPAGVKE